MALLRVDELHTYHGALHAVRGISLRVEEGEAVAVLGANGAGKSTLLRTISGLLIPRRGGVHFNDGSTLGMEASAVARAGLSLVPEGRQIFGDLTVWENLRLGAYARNLDGRALRAEVSRIAHWFPVIEERRDQLAGLLSGGEHQMLAVARAVMGRPRMLLLDEPSVGLSPRFARDLFGLLGKIRAETGAGMLIVEQDIPLALEMVDRAYVISLGRMVDEGPSHEIASRWVGGHRAAQTLQ